MKYRGIWVVHPACFGGNMPRGTVGDDVWCYYNSYWNLRDPNSTGIYSEIPRSGDSGSACTWIWCVWGRFYCLWPQRRSSCSFGGLNMAGEKPFLRGFGGGGPSDWRWWRGLLVPIRLRRKWQIWWFEKEWGLGRCWLGWERQQR